MVSISSLLNPVPPPLPPSSSPSTSHISPSSTPSPFTTPRSITSTPYAQSQLHEHDEPLEILRKFTHINYLPRPLTLPPPTSSSPHQQHQKERQHQQLPRLLLPPPPSTPSPHTRSTPSSSPSTSSPHPPSLPPLSSNTSSSKPPKTRGPVRYPPFETFTSPSILAHLADFNIQPPPNQGLIAANPRHIPYNSEKKAFFEKTGRESFEVFQYTFNLPAHLLPPSSGDDSTNIPATTHTVMWDYTTSLLRITPLFKSLSYSKTTPSKMLSLNPGLREITHSITGGALAAQGYWMPWLAAREVAKTFCWRIRWALVPVFGEAFAAECVPVGGDGWGVMKVPEGVVRACRDEGEGVRRWASGDGGIEDVQGFWRVGLGEESVGKVEGDEEEEDEEQKKKMGRKRKRERYAESGYGTDTDPEEGEHGGVVVSPRAALVKEMVAWEGQRGDADGVGDGKMRLPMLEDRWRAIRERSGVVEAEKERKKRFEAAMGLVRLKRGWVDFAGDDERVMREVACQEVVREMAHVGEQGGENRGGGRVEEEEGETEDEEAEMDEEVDAELIEQRGKTSRLMAERLTKEARTAYVLMQLQVADQILTEREEREERDGHKDKRRRATS